MKKVSTRTLVLMLELLVAVISHQYLVTVRQCKPDVIWLATEAHQSDLHPRSEPTIPAPNVPGGTMSGADVGVTASSP